MRLYSRRFCSTVRPWGTTRADLILHSPGYAVAERARREAPRGRLWAAASNR
jgi:hypothetical protein